MINKEFQERHRLYSISKDDLDRNSYLEQMRENLLERNGNQPEYTFGYTFVGKIINIQDASYTECMEINGDMNPRGL